MRRDRRALISAIPLGWASLPKQWKKPIVQGLVLPAHAQVSSQIDATDSIDSADQICRQPAITTLDVSPKSGRQGQTFEIFTSYQLYSGTIDGELRVQIVPPGAIPFGDGELLAPNLGPGLYSSRFSFKAEPSEQEPFVPGQYEVELSLFTRCIDGKGLIHSYVATRMTAFTIQ